MSIDAGATSGNVVRRALSFLRLDEIPDALGLTRTATRVWTPDFIVLCVLVAGSVALGRPFSKVKLPGGPIYVTEVGIVLIAGLAFWRLRLGGIWARLKSVPLVLLVIFWVAGAIATIRGLQAYGLHQILPDVGLFEFSIFVPLVAVVVDTKERLARLFVVAFAAGIVISIVYAVLWKIDPLNWFLVNDPSVAIALYMSFASLFVLARLVARSSVTPLEFVYAGIGVILVSLTTARAAIVALVCALTALVVLSSGKRVAAAVGAAGVMGLSVGGAYVLAKLQRPEAVVVTVLPIAPFQNGFAADDISRGFVGGGIVSGDAAKGRYSRRVALHQRFVLSGLTGLVPGRTYTIDFAVKPLAPTVVAGAVGDPTGLRWGLGYWKTKPIPKWQFFRRTLRATQSSETVGLVAYSGSPNVLFDDVRVGRAKAAGPVATRPAAVPPPPPPEAAEPPVPAPAAGPSLPQPPPPPQQPSPPPPSQAPLIKELGGVFGGNSREANNVHWRLSIWKFMLEKAIHEPILGVGFGKPTDFVWRGMIYDARTGDTTNSQDVTGPHNSFVNMLFRMGLLGLLPLIALLVIAAIRAWRVLVGRTLPPFDRAVGLSSVAFLVAVLVTACFSVALEGPYMGMFFWIFLGFVLTLPRLQLDGPDLDVEETRRPA